MFRLRTFNVVPALPQALARLQELAYNLWWSWNSEATELYRRLDPDLWNDTGQNPVVFLSHIAQKRLDHAAGDKAYLGHYGRVMTAFDAYLGREGWFAKTWPDLKNTTIAYFSMEFGLHESLPVYSGGLGILAGDHLKSASDLGLPLVGVGLMYRQGYFQQRITHEGWQLEEYPSLDFYQLPVAIVRGQDGQPVKFKLPIGEHEATVQAWRVQVGRVRLFLLDTDLPENPHAVREITHRLYGGDDTMRIRQEVLLGIGGLRMLDLLGIRPDVCHMNEGHAAFLTLERLRQQREYHKLDLPAAREAVTAGLIFTTHTPVPAGIDRFDDKLLTQFVQPFLTAVGLSFEEFLALGRVDAKNPNELFSMAVLALRLAGSANGVSALHGYVSRDMWHTVWPGAPRDEVPITSITNGIHTLTWIAPEISDLLTRYLGPDWIENPVDHDIWRMVADIPDLELWRAHERRRVAFVAFARKRLREQLRRGGAPPTEVKSADEVLDPEALTIGFARRFAPYKRGSLIFRQPERLARILSDADRPVQFVFGGKAHPRDDNGKEIIKQIIAHMRKPEFARRVVFLENYDITVARMFVQGCDVWLNNPIKPREASGTSGMKAAVNGSLNFSTLDGWWPEAYDGENGWAIDEGKIYDDPKFQDQIEGEAIYEILEKEIVPLFFDRGADGLPRGWIARMKNCMRTICPMFNTNRMLEEYSNMLYAPAARRYRQRAANDFGGAKSLAEWKGRLAAAWPKLRIEQVDSNGAPELPVGSKVQVRARVHLDSVKPDDVAVELYYGHVDAHGQLAEGNNQPMKLIEPAENGSAWYHGEIPCQRSGQHGFAVRVLPRNPELAHPHDTGLILWA